MLGLRNHQRATLEGGDAWQGGTEQRPAERVAFSGRSRLRRAPPRGPCPRLLHPQRRPRTRSFLHTEAPHGGPAHGGIPCPRHWRRRGRHFYSLSWNLYCSCSPGALGTRLLPGLSGPSFPPRPVLPGSRAPAPPLPARPPQGCPSPASPGRTLMLRAQVTPELLSPGHQVS